MGSLRHTREEIRAAIARHVAAPLRAGPARRAVGLRVLPCAYGGGDEDIIERCPSCSGGGKHVRECEIHGRCTHDPVNPAVMDCRRCRREGLGFAPAAPPRFGRAALPPFPERPKWVSTAQLVRDAIALAGLLPADCSGVVGVPRSGLLPAAVIATHLHLPLHTFDGATLHRCRVGHSRGGGVAGGSGPLAVVDDTTFSGNAMRRTREMFAGQSAVFCAVYVNPSEPKSVAAADLYARALPAPHMLEWNLANNWQNVAFDLDGVIVHDRESGGPVGSPYLVPRRRPVPLIATGRHERHRVETESLLSALGVRWERLEMLPDATPQTWENAAAHKAIRYRAAGCGYFIESEPAQAEIIHRLTGKPVICPRAERVFQ